MAVQRRGEETRERILEAALECFACDGYDASGVAEICRRAGGAGEARWLTSDFADAQRGPGAAKPLSPAASC